MNAGVFGCGGGSKNVYGARFSRVSSIATTISTRKCTVSFLCMVMRSFIILLSIENAGVNVLEKFMYHTYKNIYSKKTHMHTCTNIHNVCTCMHVCTCINGWMYVRVCVGMHVYMYVCMCLCVHMC